MADFNSEFWSWFINIIVIGGIVWLIRSYRPQQREQAEFEIIATDSVRKR